MSVVAVKATRASYPQLRMRALLFGVELEVVDSDETGVYADLVGTTEKTLAVAQGYAEVLDVAATMPR